MAAAEDDRRELTRELKESRGAAGSQVRGRGGRVVCAVGVCVCVDAGGGGGRRSRVALSRAGGFSFSPAFPAGFCLLALPLGLAPRALPSGFALWLHHHAFLWAFLYLVTPRLPAGRRTGGPGLGGVGGPGRAAVRSPDQVIRPLRSPAPPCGHPDQVTSAFCVPHAMVACL